SYLENYDPIDGFLNLNEEPEWWYEITVANNGGASNVKTITNKNKDGGWVSEYTWKVNESHEFTGYTHCSIVDISINLWDSDDYIIFDTNEVADLNYKQDLTTFNAGYNFKLDKIDFGNDHFIKDGDWYICNGELDGSTDADEEDAEMRFKIEDNYEIMQVSLDTVEDIDETIPPGTTLSYIGAVENGIPPFHWELYPYSISSESPGGVPIVIESSERTVEFDPITYTDSHHGNYHPRLVVTDKYFDIRYDDVKLIVNRPPNKPEIKRIVGGYQAIASDPDDQDNFFYYKFDINGDEKEWQDSSLYYTDFVGEPVKVKVKDYYGGESIWSEPCYKTKSNITDLTFLEILSNLLEKNPSLQLILNKCRSLKI
ncbi:hypothetical protein MBGDN05_00854, partial [Thermoplasmatales archaeon SCGC AB-539-N05]